MAAPIPTPNQTNSPHRPSPPGATPASPPNKRDLKSWWKGFKLPSKQSEITDSRAPGIFGVPLRQSITYANVAISLIDEHGQSYIYGYVPIVVAKCGVYLKEKATGVEGIFRLSGSEKRIKELKHIFDSPDRYGKGLVWEGYTVHDASNVLRRYLNDLPEPVVPLSLYEKFRDPLRGATKLPSVDAEGPQFVDSFDEQAAICKYQQLITELPPLNRQLLLYILDLLAVFAAKSDENRMNSQNLAAIFQPGMLSHPNHAMAPEEYRLNQCVLIFLIENQDHFLIGMQGTAADEKTKKEVESGTPTTPNAKSVTRTASNASAGAHSVRKEGQVRRNRSVSSKHSRGEGSVGSHSPSHATAPAGGLGRSNTLPSKKSPGLAGSKYRKVDSQGRHSPARLEPMTPVRQGIVLNESRESSPSSAAVGATHLSAHTAQATGPSQERLLEVPRDLAPGPTKERNLQSLFSRSPADGLEKRQPNKLKKKRIPGSVNISAQSSNASLVHSNTASPVHETANPMDSIQPISEQPALAPTNHIDAATDTTHLDDSNMQQPVAQTAAESSPAEKDSEQKPSLPHQSSDASSLQTPRASQIVSNSSLHPDDTLRANQSPPSVHSSFNEGSDLDQAVDDQAAPLTDSSDKEKKKRWRLSWSKKDENAGSSTSLVGSNQANIGTNIGAETSTTTVGSAGSKPRKSFTQDRPEPHQDTQNNHDAERDGSKDDPKGPLGWIKTKYREAKENAEQRRNKSPPADRHGLGAVLPSRRKSVETSTEKSVVERPVDTLMSKETKPLETLSMSHNTESSHETPKFVEEISPPGPVAPLESVPEVPNEVTPEHTEQSPQAQCATVSQAAQSPVAVSEATSMPGASGQNDTLESQSQPPKHE